MNHQTKRCLIYSALYLLVLPAFAGSAQAAECREPMYGTALVDGDYGEWNLNTDFFVDMHHAWNKPTVLSKLYLRYDCAANVMYVLVLTTNHDRTMETTAEEAWIIIDGGKAVDDTYQSFKWIDKMSNMAVGWEASFILDPGNHVIKAHSNVWWDNESQTSGTSDISLCPSCPVLGAIGDYVWKDLNKNGLQDDGAMSTVGIGGIDITLVQLDDDGNALREFPTVTRADGWYLFSDLEAGHYFVDVNEADADMPHNASGHAWVQSMLTAENKHDPHGVDLAAGQVYLQADFGFADLINPALATIGDYTWWDEDDNNQQWHSASYADDLELPFTCVGLYQAGVLKARAKTDRYGHYLFYNVPFGSYTVCVSECGSARPYFCDTANSTVAFGTDAGGPSSSGGSGGPINGGNGGSEQPYWALYDWQFTGVTPFGNNHSVTVNETQTNDLSADFPFQEQEPIVVQLLSLQAVQQPDGMHITWRSASESGVAGYYVLRLVDPRMGFVRLHDRLISATGVNESGYEYIEPLHAAGIHSYKIEEVRLDGTVDFSESISVTLSLEPAAVSANPHTCALYPNYPNPFNPQTAITFQLSSEGNVLLAVYDVTGEVVRNLLDCMMPAGEHALIWDGQDERGQPAPSGTYFCRLTFGSFVEIRRMVLLK